MDNAETTLLEEIKSDIKEIKGRLRNIEEQLKKGERSRQYQSGFGISIACMSAGMAVAIAYHNVLAGLLIFIIGVIIGIRSYILLSKSRHKTA